MTGQTSVGFLSAALTDLTARVETLAARLDAGVGVEDATADAERLRAVEAAVVQLRVEAAKREQLAREQGGGGGAGGAGKSWDGLGVEETQQRWWALRRWVDWLIQRNDIGPKEIPHCWFLHGGYVDELEALRWAWLDSYRPDAKGVDPLWWRESLGRARQRWPQFNANGCGVTHSPSRARSTCDERAWSQLLQGQVGQVGA